MVKKSILAKVGDKINYKLIRDGYKTGKGNVVVTAEMDTKTTIVADVPSTAYASNLDYEVDISGKNPPIINIKNDITCPDDTVISKGKYLFYNIGQKYNVKNTNWKPEFAEPNGYTIVGSPTISSEFIMTNFNKSNYISTPNLDYSSPFILEMHLKLSSYPSGWVFKSSVDYSLDTYFGNSMIIAIGNGSNYHDMAITPSLPFDGKMILKWDGNIYTYIAIDEVSDTTYGPVTYSSSSVIPSSPMKIGYKNCDYIDLKKFIFTSSDPSKSYRVVKDESIINIPGIKDFTLNDNGTELTTKLFDYHYKEEIPYKVNLTKIGNISINPDGTVSNFSTSNYLRMLDKPSSSTTNFEMLFRFKCTSFSNSEILMGDSGNVWNNVLIYVYDNRFQIGINRNWYTGTHNISLNKEYWGKVIFNNGTLSSYISEDGITYEQDYTGSLSSYVWNNNADIGYSAADNIAFRGTIWLEDCYIQYGTNEKKYFAERPQSNDKTSLYINTEKDNNLYYEKDELQLNVSKVGTAAVNENGIASNFGNNSYVTFGKLNAGDNPWEMVFKVKYKEHSGFQRFCGSSSGNPRNLLITVSDEDKLSLYISTNGSDWSIQRQGSKTTLVNNTTYYIKALFNGTNYILSLSTDGINYNEEINEASTTPMYNGVSTNFQIGCAFSDESQYNWQGTIDLKESYIQIGTNEKKYFAEKVTKRYNIPSLYSEFIDNITIPAHALYEYVNGEWKLSGDSPVITQDITVNADNAEIAMKEIIE